MSASRELSIGTQVDMTIGQMVYTVLRDAITGGAFALGEWLRQGHSPR